MRGIVQARLEGERRALRDTCVAMSHENVEVVRRGVACANEGPWDVPEALEAVARIAG